MRYITIVFVVVLVLDVLVGSALIVWKCAYTDETAECKLATFGTLGCTAVWLLWLLAYPSCVKRCDLHDAWQKLQEKVKDSLKRLRGQKRHQVYIQSEIYLPTTFSLKRPRDDAVVCDVNIIAADTQADDKCAHPLMSPKIEDVVSVPAVIYTFNGANGNQTGSTSPVTCVEMEEPCAVPQDQY